jgi:hypothetical protein
MSSVNAIKRMLELLGTCGVDSLGEIAYLDAHEDVDAMIKGVTNPGGTFTR